SKTALNGFLILPAKTARHAVRKCDVVFDPTLEIARHPLSRWLLNEAGTCNEDDSQIDARGGVACRRGNRGSDIRDGGSRRLGQHRPTCGRLFARLLPL